jgi:hypothetical protein
MQCVQVFNTLPYSRASSARAPGMRAMRRMELAISVPPGSRRAIVHAAPPKPKRTSTKESERRRAARWLSRIPYAILCAIVVIGACFAAHDELDARAFGAQPSSLAATRAPREVKAIHATRADAPRSAAADTGTRRGRKALAPKPHTR